MGTPAFPNLGKHCSVSDCNQLDFLPFTCDVCHQVFCLDHRSYSKHQCPNAKDRDSTVLVCPLCAKSVRIVPSEDPNITWDRHVQTDCDPNNYAKVHKKPRCPVRGCKETLTVTNKMVCKDCKQEVCLKHRFGPDHNCPGQTKTNKDKAWYSGPLVDSFRRGASAGGSKKQSMGATTSNGHTGWSSILRSSAEAGISKLNNLTTSVMSAVGGTSSNSQSEQRSKPGSSREVCPQCGVEFSCVSLLIQHVESSHNRSKPVSINDVVDLCPKCGRGFLDPISLVNHVERDHGGTSKKR
ncbi:hypothetical protein KP509_13G069600 [Ceratopteris richardii]|uniref:Uncharacterized protein n=1 Tax=Ceratopteris richardii TaxID=49495 RepID=A0A8T2TGN3_CERRI|nr:hypothetical protein KP509_13G069600 [Ceratopteris richardii]